MANQSAPLTPTFQGHIASTLDALDLIKSGNIFIYEEHSSGIKRWTDGVSWSPSRILGNFLIYRELEKPLAPDEKKRALKKNKKSSQGIAKSQQASRPQSSTSEDQERSLIGSLVDSYPFKNNGLVKKTISICFQGVAYHMVSYYNLLLALNSSSLKICELPLTRLSIAVPAWYASDQGSIGNSNGVLHRAMLHGNLQTAMSNIQQSHQGSSPAAYMFPQQPPDTHNGYPGPVANSAFKAAMPQRASLYDASGHRSDIGMPFGSSGTEARHMVSNPYLALQAYYMTQQHQGAAPSTQASPCPMSRGLRSESNAIPADNSVNHSYSLDGTAWRFEPLEGDSDQQQYYAQNHVQWPNGVNPLHRT
ncbi:hypothetical protein MY11210_005478 [Beauveria gryllotalpidicola]